MEIARVDEYLKNILKISNSQSSYDKILLELFKRIMLSEDGQIVCVSTTLKREIANTLNCTAQYISNAISDMGKSGIFIKITSGSYLLNPKLFGTKEFKDISNIEEIELIVTLTSKGKEIQVRVHLKG